PVKAGCPLSALSPDGKVLATLDDNPLRLWSLETGRPLGSLQVGPGRVVWLRFGGGSRMLVVGYANDRVACYTLPAGRRSLLRFPGHTFAKLSPDGKVLATIGKRDDTLRLWDTSTGLSLGDVGKARYGFGFSPDGRRLVVTGGFT